MKLTFLFLMIGLMHVSASVYSQSTKLTLELRNKKVVEVLDEIEKQSEFRFAYSSELIDVNRKVSVNINDKKIEKTLDIIFEGTGVTYALHDRHIMLYPKEMGEASMLMQQNPISGKVIDEQGQTLPGVTVVIKGTTRGTVTNMDGNYSIPSIPDDAILVFSFVGMQTQEIAVGSQTSINITMLVDAIGIEEVVAIGYGTIRRSDLTGSVASLKGKDLVSSSIISVEQGLQGRAAGVQVSQSSGQPGSAPRIRIRGTNSINGGSDPLYVIDGFPIYSSSSQVSGNVLMRSAGFNPLSTINPNDIESVEVLKDASATAIYGSRASNGVIMITTKRGKAGKPRVAFEAYYGFQSLNNKIDLLNAQEYAIIQNEAYERRGKSLRYSQADIESLGSSGGTDWQDELYQSSVPTQNYNLSVNGGNENTKYSLSAGYFSQDGLIINSGFERASFRLNLDQKISDKLSIGTNFSYSQVNSELAMTNTDGSKYGGVSFRALIEDPTKPVYTQNGEFNYDKAGLFWGGNAVADATLLENTAITGRLTGNIFTKWQITPEIAGKVVFGVDMLNSEERSFMPSELYRSNGQSSASLGKVADITWVNDYTLTFKKLINNIHDVNVVVGSSLQGNSHNSLVGRTKDLIFEGTKYYSLGGGSNPYPPGSYFSDWSFASFFGRANYILNDKYLLTVTGRYDGASRFGDSNKWGFFPSASFAWRLAEEDFIKSLNVFSNLKLRTSYGITGNSELGLYKSQQVLSQTSYSFGNQFAVGFGPNSSNIANPDLGWESTSQFDIGLDLGFVENRITANIDYYHKTTEDLLLNLTVPPSSVHTTMKVTT